MKRFFLVVSSGYLVISFFFLRGILTSPGVLTGNDWGLPVTLTQMQQIFYDAFYTWTNNGNLFGQHLVALNDALFRLFLGLFSQFNLRGEWLTKGIALFLLTTSGFTLYYLCRYLKCSQKASFLAGLFYITTPPFFNYLCMGWIYVLLCFALLPMAIITFDKSLKESGLKYKILTTFIFSLALFQFQALFWFALVFILYSIFYITSWGRIKRCCKSLFFIALSVLLLSAYWVLPLIFSSAHRRFQAPISAYDFSRFGARLNLLDMSRLWGSLFNSQFESALPNILVVFTFLLPLFAYLALILRSKNRCVLFFTTLSLIPLGIFLTRKIMLFIPYSGIFRDYSRHFILSALAYSVLLAFSLDALYDRFKNIKFLTRSKIVPSAIFISLFVGINILVSYPFWSNSLSKEAKLGSDVRLKTIQFSPEYQRTEEWLFKKEGDFKTLWLPAGGIIAFWDKPKTSGPYGTTWDLFAAYARKPGQILITDRLTGPTRNFAEIIQVNIYTNESLYLADIIRLANMRYLIVRTNAYSDPNKLSMRKICQKLENDAKFQKVLVDDSVTVFENAKVLPHIYSSTTRTVVDRDASKFK